MNGYKFTPWILQYAEARQVYDWALKETHTEDRAIFMLRTSTNIFHRFLFEAAAAHTAACLLLPRIRAGTR
ncbi:MAG: hypothetical protein H7Z41_19015 [Cytophagales bacterium]|nr:hypothetical protein [Armatimonadota bacterium]